MTNPVSQPADFRGRARSPSRTVAGAAAVILLLDLVNLSAVPGGGDTPAVRPETLQLHLDPNAASHDELMLLPGIGPKLAENIITYRTATRSTPAFTAAEDLDNVSRIGPITVQRLRPYLRFPPATDTPPAGARP